MSVLSLVFPEQNKTLRKLFRLGACAPTEEVYLVKEDH